MNTIKITWDEVQKKVEGWVPIIRQYGDPELKAIVGIARGGVIPAYMLKKLLTINSCDEELEVKVVEPFTSSWMDDYK